MHYMLALDEKMSLLSSQPSLATLLINVAGHLGMPGGAKVHQVLPLAPIGGLELSL